MVEITEIERRVAAGARRLDTVDPTWFQRVYLDALQLSNCELCVLGQVFHDYATGVTKLTGFASAQARYQFAVEHGFDTEGDGIEDPSELVYLEKAWHFEITERLLKH